MGSLRNRFATDAWGKPIKPQKDEAREDKKVTLGKIKQAKAAKVKLARRTQKRGG